MIESIFLALGAGLRIWEHKSKNKYNDRLLKLKRDYYEEESKDNPDRNTLDNIEFELHVLSQAFDNQTKE